MSVYSLYNDTRVERVFKGTCKFCGRTLRWAWSSYHKANKPYELDSNRYHTCDKPTSMTIIKLSPEEMLEQYGPIEKPTKKYASSR